MHLAQIFTHIFEDTKDKFNHNKFFTSSGVIKNTTNLCYNSLTESFCIAWINFSILSNISDLPRALGVQYWGGRTYNIIQCSLYKSVHVACMHQKRRGGPTVLVKRSSICYVDTSVWLLALCHSLSSNNMMSAYWVLCNFQPPMTITQTHSSRTPTALIECPHLLSTTAGILEIWKRCGWEKCCQCDGSMSSMQAREIHSDKF